MKKILIIIGILVLLAILFKGALYRKTVTYTKTGSRKHISITSQELIRKIEKRASGKKINLESIVKIASSITTEVLSFDTKNVSNNPNTLLQSHKANCIGYAAMFNSVANYLIEKNDLNKELSAKHHVGKLEILGIDVHQYFDSSFFKDHDYNEIREMKTNHKVFVDPSLSNYLGVKKIVTKEIKSH